jgi:DNA-binding transcriptional LysR family regulator
MQSFSKVAQEINVNQSIISRNIKDLEKTLNCKLILDNQKPIALTKEGEELYQLAEKIHNDMYHISQNLTFQAQYNYENKIKIFLAISMILGPVLAERINKLLKMLPEIYIDISFTNTITMDLLNEKDIVITREPYINESLVENEFINKYKMVFGASREYLKKRGYPKFASSLKYHDFIYIENYYYDIFASKEILNNISKQYILNNELAALQAISSGGGVGMLPQFVTQTFNNIVTFELDEKLESFELYASVSKVRANSYITLITDFLKNEL